MYCGREEEVKSMEANACSSELLFLNDSNIKSEDGYLFAGWGWPEGPTSS
jgi:hypothetical protein